MATAEQSLYGAPQGATNAEGYESPEQYADQGDTRVVRDLMFSYLVQVGEAAGAPVLEPREARRDDEVSIEQIGLQALMLGEKNNSFYTSKQLDRLNKIGRETEPVTAEAEISSMGEFELSEWLATNSPETGRAWTINEVLEKVGSDKDLAHRMLQAENIRSDGDPRDGLEKGLQAIIQES